MSALEGLCIHLGGIKQGRKSLVIVTEGFEAAVSDVRDIYEAAARANVAVYPLDPRGLTGEDRGTTAQQMLNGTLSDRDTLRSLALETGGRAIVERNDIRAELGRVIQDASAYYLLAYESPHRDDGKFHRVTVSVTRPRTTVFARTGYWSPKRGTTTDAAPSLALVVPAAVQSALNQLAESLRPNAAEPIESPRRIKMPPEAVAAPPAEPPLAPPTAALVRGRVAGPPVARHEFRRIDTLLLRSATATPAQVHARLLDRHGQLLTDLPVTAAAGAAEVTLVLANLGVGDYVIEMATDGAGGASQYFAFRLAR
jgi:hypothetical protein